MPLNREFWIIAGTAALVVSAGAAWWWFHRKRTPEAEVSRESDREILLAGLARHAQLYDGLYEGIYQIASREDVPSRDAVKEFCGRTARLEEDAAFSRAFAARFAGSADAEPAVCRRQMEELLELFQAAGITRSQETELPLSPQVRREYIFLGEPVPEDGTVCRVMKPCWRHQGRLVEQGILMAKEAAQ